MIIVSKIYIRNNKTFLFLAKYGFDFGSNNMKINFKYARSTLKNMFFVFLDAMQQKKHYNWNYKISAIMYMKYI